MSGLGTSGWIACLAILSATVAAALVAAPDGILLAVPALAGLALGWSPRGAQLLVGLLPLVVVLNLEPLREAPDALYPSEALILASFVAFAVRRGAAWATPFALALAAFSGWLILAAVVTGPQEGLQLLLRPLRLACLAWVGFELVRMTLGVDELAIGALGAVGLLGLSVVVEALIDLRSGVPSVGALVGDSELFAIHHTLWLPLVVGVVLGELDSGLRKLGWLVLAVGIVALGISYSRSGWIGGWTGMLVVSGLVTWRGGGRHARIFLGLLCVSTIAVGLVLFGLVTPPGVPEGYIERLQTLGRSGLFAGRTREWGVGLEVLREHPIFGSPSAPNCYNLILGLASRSGWPVLLPFLAVVGMALAGAWRALDTRPSLAAGIIGSIVALFLTGIGESSLGTRVIAEAFAVLGAGVALGSADASPGRGGEPRRRRRRSASAGDESRSQRGTRPRSA